MLRLDKISVPELERIIRNTIGAWLTTSM